MRAFLGIPLPEEVREEISAQVERLFSRLRGVKWVEKENYHITLKFLGEVEEETAALLLKEVSTRASTFPPFSVDLSGFGAFPTLRSPRVIWVGIKSGGDLVGKLHEVIEEVAESRGFPREAKKFHPHVTVGRVKRPGGGGLVLEKEDSLPFGRVRVDRFHLYRSTLTKAGPIYDIIGSVFLEGEEKKE
ncbi:MAG: RNA 2',3'-cyclic phosphodiesterase [Deltaproteobacteria bacterium]|nr:MAG: RNA 2',3'-cyclic phosphodiesterase [Deltaproteobacteria bacterium]